MILSDRLKLRNFTENDCNDLFEYLREISINCFMEMKADTLDQCKASLRQRIANPLYMAIELKESGKVIGEIFSEAITTNEFGGPKDTYSLCWMLNSNFQKKGYMKEAAIAYIDYLFRECKARRAFAYTEDYNVSCQKLLENLGFRKEGYYKEFVSFVNDSDGKPVFENTYEYAILKKEWESLAVARASLTH
ncbi:MAG: GNAT family N-acetyltransferase [Treponema sp.]|nr:GNAT family N-acetyltransferase [Treponema sp.]